MKQSFELLPFPDHTAIAWQGFALSTTIWRHKQQIDLTFQLTGTLTDLVLPEAQQAPIRQGNLWESTCFECFFGSPFSSEYWEVNISPSGDWNIYQFTNYRAGMAEEMRIQTLPLHTQYQASQFSLYGQLPLEPIGLSATPLELSCTTVLQTKSGDLSYWAIAHRDNQPNFHQRSSFTATL